MLLILFCLLFYVDGVPLAKLHNASVSLGEIHVAKMPNSDLISKIMSSKDNNEVLLNVLSDADPVQLNEVITLLKALLATSRTELEGLISDSGTADTAYTDAVAAHDAAVVAQINGLEALRTTQTNAISAANSTYDQGVIALQDAVDAAKGLVDSTNATKITANAVLATDSDRLNSEINTLITVITLMEGLLGINTFSPTSSPTANLGGWGQMIQNKACDPGWDASEGSDVMYDPRSYTDRTYSQCKELCEVHWGCNCIEYDPVTKWCTRRMNCNVDKCRFINGRILTLWDRPPMNCNSAVTLHVTHTNHPTEGDNGKYFYFDQAEWTAMVGDSASGVQIVKQTGSRDWTGPIVVRTHQGPIYGQRQKLSDVNQFAAGDLLNLCVQPASLGGWMGQANPELAYCAYNPHSSVC